MARYETLSGGRGGQIFFRPKRRNADARPGEDLLEVTLSGQPVRINDYSLSGISVIDPSSRFDWQGQIGRVAELSIRLTEDTLFAGNVRLVRTQESSGVSLIGCAFEGDMPDLSAIAIQQAQAHLERMTTRTPSLVSAQVPMAYRALCSDVLQLLNWHRQQVETFHRQFDDEAEEEALETACQVIEQPVLEEWRQLWQRGEDIVRGLQPDSAAFDATKRYTEQVLTPAFMGGPIWERSFSKPLDYPGDFEVMKMVYDWARKGATPTDRMVHRIGLEVAECIATRMVLVQQAIAATIAEHGNAGPARITSLGCGPAKEVENVLSASRMSGSAVFTLIDQDLDALDDTFTRLTPKVRRLSPHVQLELLHESFLRVVRGGMAGQSIKGQHLIYTVGLVDYLSASMARSMVFRLYKKLAPGGLLIVGNMADSKLSNFWPMEFIADWRVKYRSREEMTDMAVLCPNASVEVRREQTGRVWMLYVRKPA